MEGFLGGLGASFVEKWGEAGARLVDRQTRLPSDDPDFEEGEPGFSVYDLRGGFDFDFGPGIAKELPRSFFLAFFIIFLLFLNLPFLL